MQVEGLLPVFLGEDQFVYVDLLGMVLLQVPQKNQKQREAGEPLLAVYDVADTFLLADDNGAEKIVRVVRDLAARVRGLIFLQKLVAQVVHKLANLLLLPLVFALVVINGVFHSLEQLADRLRFP